MLQGAYADNLSWQHAGDSLLMTVLGGVHHFLGPLWGAIAFILLEDRLSAITESWWLIFAPVVIIFALASPEGMQGLVFRLMRPRRLDAGRAAASRRARRASSPIDGGGDAAGPGQADPAGARPEQAVRLAGGGERHPSRCASIPPAQPDRAERRRQDHVLQHADRPAARRRRQDQFRRPGHHPPAGASAHPPGPQPLVPDPQRVPQSDDVRERAGRGAGAEPGIAMACGATPMGSTRSTTGPGRCSRRSGWRIVPRNPAPISRTARSGCWKSPSRSPPMPNCCCSTSRWPVSPKRIGEVVGALIRQLPRRTPCC